jgi:hypothetical protein
MKAPYPLIEGLAGAQKEKISTLWTVSDALHEMIFREHRHEYLQRTLGFLQGLIHQG